MAQPAAGQQRQGSSGQGNSAGQPAEKKERNRKQYDHEMTPAEKMALHKVQAGQEVLRVVNDAIKSGKKIDAEVIQLCHKLEEAATRMLFGG